MRSGKLLRHQPGICEVLTLLRIGGINVKTNCERRDSGDTRSAQSSHDNTGIQPSAEKYRDVLTAIDIACQALHEKLSEMADTVCLSLYIIRNRRNMPIFPCFRLARRFIAKAFTRQ